MPITKEETIKSIHNFQNELKLFLESAKEYEKLASMELKKELIAGLEKEKKDKETHLINSKTDLLKVQSKVINDSKQFIMQVEGVPKNRKDIFFRDENSEDIKKRLEKIKAKSNYTKRADCYLEQFKKNDSDLEQLKEERTDVLVQIRKLKSRIEFAKNLCFHDITFAKKILLSDKVDPKKYEKYVNEEYKKYITSISGYPEKLEKFEKIKKRFDDMSSFASKYRGYLSKAIEVIHTIKQNNIEYMVVLNELSKKMVKLEKQEMQQSLKSIKDDFIEIRKKISTISLNRNDNGKIKIDPTPTNNKLKKSDKLSCIFSGAHIFEKNIKYTLQTPFKEVELKYEGRSRGILVSCPSIPGKLDYTSMAKALDDIEDKNKKINLINAMLSYIAQKVNTSILEAFNSLPGNSYAGASQKILNSVVANSFDTNGLSNDQIHAAAVISATMLISESNPGRNPTFGRLERGAIKTILYLAKNDCKNPFQKVMNAQKGRFVAAHNPASFSDISVSAGGVKQEQMLLGYDPEEKTILRDYLPGMFTDPQRILDKTELNQFKKEVLRIGEKSDIDAFFDIKGVSNDVERKLSELEYIFNEESDKKFKRFIYCWMVKIAIGVKNRVKISDLPNDPKYKVDFGDGKKRTAKEFIKYQMGINLKKLYKSQNQTPTNAMIEKKIKEIFG